MGVFVRACLTCRKPVAEGHCTLHGLHGGRATIPVEQCTGGLEAASIGNCPVCKADDGDRVACENCGASSHRECLGPNGFCLACNRPAQPVAPTFVVQRSFLLDLMRDRDVFWSSTGWIVLVSVCVHFLLTLIGL